MRASLRSPWFQWGSDHEQTTPLVPDTSAPVWHRGDRGSAAARRSARAGPIARAWWRLPGRTRRRLSWTGLWFPWTRLRVPRPGLWLPWTRLRLPWTRLRVPRSWFRLSPGLPGGLPRSRLGVALGLVGSVGTVGLGLERAQLGLGLGTRMGGLERPARLGAAASRLRWLADPFRAARLLRLWPSIRQNEGGPPKRAARSPPGRLMSCVTS